MKVFAGVALYVGMMVLPATALPPLPVTDVPEQPSDLLVEVATASQKRLANAACRRQYGSRLAYVSIRGNSYTCHFRKSNKQLTKEASRSCKKSGMRLKRVNSIKVKGSKVVTRFTCSR
jgi:hypothetical protein